MDNARINTSVTPRATTGAGELTTFYSYESGPARSLVLANMAWLLAGRQHATVPVLMIDWDLESPGLHYLFGADRDRPGLLELMAACREQCAQLAGAGLSSDDMARQVLAAVDWHSYIERVDAGRPLYMLRAGRFDDSYGERAAQLDWQDLHRTCPALLRALRVQLAQAFRHVFIDARCGRSAAVSVCTTLLPDKIVGLFTPHPASLDGLCGAVRRAIDYRCSHEEEQRPLLLYPLPCAPAGADRAHSVQWRRGEPPHGYQVQLEALMRASYALRHCSLEDYCDDILLHTTTFFTDAGAGMAADGNTGHASPARTLATLLEWFVPGKLPWQSYPGRVPLDMHPARADAPRSAPPGEAQFPALRHLALFGDANGETASPWDDRERAPRHAGHLAQLADAVETQLDQLQKLIDQRALREARPVADRLRHLVLRPSIALKLRQRGAALIKLVYRHDNDTDALLAFTQDELAALERVLNDAAAGRPLAFS